MTAQPPTHQPGLIENLVGLVKGLSFQNVMIITILVVILLPTYLLWSVVNDPVKLGRFLSSYEEFSTDKSPCTLRIASLRGAGDTYSISTGFALQGSDKWAISVIMDRKPTDAELHSYCETLQLLVDFMRNPDAHPPMAPGTEEPLIHMYPDGP